MNGCVQFSLLLVQPNDDAAASCCTIAISVLDLSAAAAPISSWLQFICINPRDNLQT